MKTAVVCLCLSFFVASNAFILGGEGMRGLMTLNMLSNRSPLDFSMFGMGGEAPQAQGAAASSGAAGASRASAASAAAAASAAGRGGRRGGLFSNPIVQLSLLGGEGFF